MTFRGSCALLIDRWRDDICVTLCRHGSVDDYDRYVATAENWETYEELDSFESYNFDEALEAFNRMVNKFQMEAA